MSTDTHPIINPEGGAPTGDALWQPDANGASWDESFWKGLIGALGVEFKAEVAIGVVGGDSGNFLYDNAQSLYDTSTYSLNDTSWVDLTERLIQFNAGRGRDHFGQRFKAGAAALTFSNQDGIFNPLLGFQFLGEQALRPGRWVRVSGKRTDSVVWEPMWVGRIQNLQDVYSDGATGIHSVWACLGLEAWLSSIDPPTLDTPDPVTAGQRTDERVRYIIEDLLGLPPEFLITDEPGLATMLETDFPGSRLDSINDAVDAEAGAFYATRDGKMRFRNRPWLEDSPDAGTIQFLIGTPSDDIEIIQASTSWDAIRIKNNVNLQREGGVVQSNINSTSIGIYGTHSFTRSGLQNETDAQVVDLVTHELKYFSFDTLRLDSIVIWASEMSEVDHLLTLELGMRVAVTVQTGEGWAYTVVAWVNGIQHQVTAKDWKVTLRLDNTDRTSPLTGGAYSSAYSDAFSVREDT